MATLEFVVSVRKLESRKHEAQIGEIPRNVAMPPFFQPLLSLLYPTYLCGLMVAEKMGKIDASNAHAKYCSVHDQRATALVGRAEDDIRRVWCIRR